jgi:hypothetical protein
MSIQIPPWASITVWILLGYSMVNLVFLNSMKLIHHGKYADFIQQSSSDDLGFPLSFFLDDLSLSFGNISHSNTVSNDKVIARS